MDKNILKNSTWNFGAQVLVKAVSFFYTVFLARSLGVSNFGSYVVALAYFSIISSAVDFGFNRFLIREVAINQLKVPQLLWNIMILRLTLTSVFFAIFSIVLYLLDSDKTRVSLILLATLAILPQSISLTFDAIFVAIQKLQFSALALFASAISTAFLGVLFVSFGFGSIGAINALIIGQVIYFLVLAIFLRKYKLQNLSSVSLPVIKKVIKGSLPYGVLGIIGLVSFRIDIPILSYFRGNFETGIYGAAYKFLDAVIFIPTVLAMASFPIFARSIEKDLLYVRKLYFRSIKIMLIVGLTVMLVYLIILPEVMKFLLPNYLSSLGILRILALSIPVIFVHIPSNQLLLSQEKNLKHLILIYIVLFSVNVILYLIFIPPLGAQGAAGVTVLSELFTLIALFLYLSFKVFRKR